MEEEYSSMRLMENNVKIYTKYKMFAYDWVFFYAVSVLFFSITKHFSTSQIVYITGFYTLAYCIFQLPSNFFVRKLGLKKSIIIGNILSAVTLLIYIFAKDFEMFVFAQFVNGLSFALKGLSESDLLCTSMKRLGKFDKFSKVEGASNAKYYFFDGIASIASGFMFVTHQYLPVILCLIVTIIALIQSIKFNDVELDINKEEKVSIKKSIVHFLKTIRSDRLKCIYMFAFVFTGILQVNSTLYKSILMDIGMDAQFITVLVFFYMIGAGLGSKLFFKFENCFKNKSLTVISIAYSTGLGILGVFGLLSYLNMVTLVIILLVLFIMGFVHGAYKVALRKYTVSFTTSKIRTRITSIGLMFEYAGTTIILFVCAYLLDHTINSFGAIVISIVSLLVFYFILKFMEGRIGLKPEEYAPKDINNVKLK